MELSELRPYIDLIRSYPYKKQELSDLGTQINNTQAELTATCKEIDETKSSFLTKIFKNSNRISNKLETLNQKKSELESILKELNLRRDELKNIIDYINGLKTQYKKLLIIRENEFRGDIYHTAFPRFIEIDTKIEESNNRISYLMSFSEKINEAKNKNNEAFKKLDALIVEYKRNVHKTSDNDKEFVLVSKSSVRSNNTYFIEYDYIKNINNQLSEIDNELGNLKYELKEIGFEINIKPINSNILIEINYNVCISNNEIISKYQTKLITINKTLDELIISFKSEQDELNKLIEQLTIEKEDILINA